MTNRQNGFQTESTQAEPDSQAAPAWIDSHAHLQDEAYADDRPAVLDRAFAQQVCRILLPSSDYQDSCRAVSLAESDNRLVCAVGCHPHEAAGFSLATADALAALVAAHRQAPRRTAL